VENVPPNGMFLGVPPRILRFESLADVEERIGDVGFAPKTDRRAALLTIFRRVSSLRSSEYGMALPQAKAEPHEACPVDARDRITSSRPRPRKALQYNKERLLANGDRWERAIAKNLFLTPHIAELAGCSAGAQQSINHEWRRESPSPNLATRSGRCCVSTVGP